MPENKVSGSAKQKTVLKAHGISKHYFMGGSRVNALKKVDLDVRQGEFLMIMGPSGSGKTTLLDIVSILLQPSHGRVIIEGRDTDHMTEAEKAFVRGRKIGFIFQTFNLIHRMSALENVMLPLWFVDIPKARRREMAVKALKAVGLEERMHHRPSELSGGERQRVAIARALANDPMIIVADEPTGNLDSVSGEKVMDILCKLNNKQGKTIVMVTHDESLKYGASRILYLKDGQIVRQEHPRAVCKPGQRLREK